MSDEPKVGDRVAWTSSGGRSVGRVKKKLTKPIEIKGHHVAASPDNPELLVESDSGGVAAHKPASVKKLSAKPPARKSVTKATPKKKPAVKKSLMKKSPAKKSSKKKKA